MKTQLVGLLAFGALLLGACGGGGTSTPPPPSPALATHLSVVTPASATAGAAFAVTVRALDASNSVVSAYSGTVHFNSTDRQAALPAAATLINGTGTASITLNTAGHQTLTAADAASLLTTGDSGSIGVSPGAATQFGVAAPALAAAGAAFTFTVTALDAWNNAATGYSGTVQFTSSDILAQLPAPLTLSSGAATLQATLNTAGRQIITATDAVTATKGLSQSINVSASTTVKPVPLVYLPLNPSAVLPGTAGFSLTLKGTGFVPGSKVMWNGSPRATTFVSKSKLTAAIPPADVVSPNTASVTVVNPSPGGGASNVVFFEATFPTSAILLSAPTVAGSPFGEWSATGDFNGDGKLDVAAASLDGKFVSVFLGNGDGTFQPPANFDVLCCGSAGPVTVADVNGDGKLDIVVVTDSVTVFLGNGDGTFQPASSYGVGSHPFAVAVGDFTGHGKLDLAVANSVNSDVSVLLGKGDGTFQPAVNYATGSNPTALVIADLNGDGKLDLAVANTDDGNVSVLLGNGDGTFQPPVGYVTGTSPEALVVGDFNGDGKLDLAVANGGSNNVSVLIGNGDGTFQSAVAYGTGPGPSSMVAGDLNGDGKLDLAVATGGSYNVRVLLGNGDGTFQSAVSYAGAGWHSLAVGDLHGQGRLDLISAGELVQSTLAPSAATLTFKPQLLETSSTPQTVTFTNVGTGPTSISSVALSGPDAADFAENHACSSSLIPGATCTITITFTPTQPGPRTASVMLTDNATGSPQSIDVSGIGLAAGPNATLSTASVSFSCTTDRSTPPLCYYLCVATPSTSPLYSGAGVSLSDFGDADLSIGGIGVTGVFLQTNTCGARLGATNSCTIDINFRPTQTGTTYTGSLTVNDNAVGSPQVVNLTGVLHNSPCP